MPSNRPIRRSRRKVGVCACRLRALGSLPILLIGLLLLASPLAAQELRVAVAANFLSTLKSLAAMFEAGEGVRVVPVAGSTGKLYAQIRNGAPFDLFLAGDVERPARLEAEGLTVGGSRHTYARGRLVLWSPLPNYVQGPNTLEQGDFRHLSIANPQIAPYGAAAAVALRRLGLWERLQGRLVRGESVNQAFQFVASGSAELGLVAASQLAGREGSTWLLPESLYPPIEQQVVLLTRSAENPAAARFLDFLLHDPSADALIQAAGYDRSEPADAVAR